MEQHRTALTGHCRRILGSTFDAEDAVQEAMVRAWRACDCFEGPAPCAHGCSRIATNVCADMLKGRARREAPVELALETPEFFFFFFFFFFFKKKKKKKKKKKILDPAEVVDRARDDPARVRRGLARPAAAPARGADAVRGPPSVGRRGRRAPRDERRLGHQRPPAGPGLRSPEPTRPPPKSRGRWRRVDRLFLARYVEAFERDDVEALASLIHADAVASGA